MERIKKICSFVLAAAFLAGLQLSAVAYAEGEPGVVPGVITASNVDVTADDGSLLSERLGVGDMVYIVLQPTNQRKGWVRITRSPEDALGFGWVEDKNIQRFSAYRSSGASSSRPAPSYSPPRSTETKSQGGIAVLPFATMDPNDSYGRNLSKQFTQALKAKRKFKVVSDVQGRGVDSESVQDVRALLASKGLQGIILGKLSSPFGGNRLLQLKYLGQGSSSFTIEKVKRLPIKGDSKKAMKELANVYAKSLGR